MWRIEIDANSQALEHEIMNPTKATLFNTIVPNLMPPGSLKPYALFNPANSKKSASLPLSLSFADQVKMDPMVFSFSTLVLPMYNHIFLSSYMRPRQCSQSRFKSAWWVTLALNTLQYRDRPCAACECDKADEVAGWVWKRFDDTPGDWVKQVSRF